MLYFEEIRIFIDILSILEEGRNIRTQQNQEKEKALALRV